MSSLNAPAPEPARVVLDRSLVTAVLYVSIFTPREWRRIGAPALARYVSQVAADPRCRVPEMAALIERVDHAGALPPDHARLLAAARRFAPRVLAALSN